MDGRECADSQSFERCSQEDKLKLIRLIVRVPATPLSIPVQDSSIATSGRLLPTTTTSSLSTSMITLQASSIADSSVADSSIAQTKAFLLE